MSTIRLWDKDFQLVATLDAAECAESGEGTFTLPLDHPVAAIIRDRRPPWLYATVDDEAVRKWSGRLDHWKISRDEGCPNCGHGRDCRLTTAWIVDAHAISLLQGAHADQDDD